MKKVWLSAVAIIAGVAYAGMHYSAPAEATRGYGWDPDPEYDCGVDYTFEKEADYDGEIVTFEFEEDESWKSNYKRTISVTGEDGFTVKEVWLDVEGDYKIGYFKYGTGALTNFNPNPGDKINKAKAIVYKVCPADPTSTPVPEVTMTPTPADEPDSTPTNAPEDTESESTKKMGADVYGPDCTTRFSVKVNLMDNDEAAKDIDVGVSYKGQVYQGKSNNEGIVSAEFNYDGEGEVKVEANGYPTEYRQVKQDEDCAGRGGVLGTSTGSVLGASTMAATGSAGEMLMSLMSAAGMVMTAVGAIGYKRVNA